MIHIDGIRVFLFGLTLLFDGRYLGDIIFVNARSILPPEWRRRLIISSGDRWFEAATAGQVGQVKESLRCLNAFLYGHLTNVDQPTIFTLWVEESFPSGHVPLKDHLDGRGALLLHGPGPFYVLAALILWATQVDVSRKLVRVRSLLRLPTIIHSCHYIGSAWLLLLVLLLRNPINI